MTQTIQPWRKWIAALLLAMVALHAAPGGAVAIERVNGSAFDVTTVDVAVAPKRQVTTSVLVAAIVPAPQPVETATQTHAAVGLVVPVRPDSTGPPTRTIGARPCLPRAPPFS